MNIAVLTSSYPRFRGDGTAPFVKSIAEQLASSGNNVEVLAPYDPLCEPTAENIVKEQRFRYIWPAKFHIMGHAQSLDADVRLRPLTYILLPLFLLSAFFHLWRLTGRQRSEVIHVHWVVPNGPVAAWVARLRGIPFVISLHGSDIYVAGKNRLFAAVARWTFGQAAGVTACSNELRSRAIDLGAPQNIQLIAWGADPELFSPEHRSDRILGRGRETIADPITIAALGRLVHKKGFDKLLAAVPEIVKCCPEAKIVIGGSGPLQTALHQQALDLGIEDHVAFAGRIPWNDVPGFLASADIFVLPSLHDRFGNVDGLPTVVPEAMASGLPIVASDIGGVNLLINHGQNGLLVPAGDVKALVEAIKPLLRDREMRRQMGSAARNDVVHRFNWKNVGKQLISIFEVALWKNGLPVRLGTIYRQETLNQLGKISDQGQVLDVGCHDGYFLSSLEVPVRIGVDPEPMPGAPEVQFVKADGCNLPFKSGQFNAVFALDVIEHIENDAAFAQEISRMLSPGGKIYLTTPSKYILITPPFLTKWVSQKWGHHLKPGYAKAELERLFSQDLAVSIHELNAPGYRTWYLILRALSPAFPRLVGRQVIKIARRDIERPAGKHGFFFLEATKPTDSGLSEVAQN